MKPGNSVNTTEPQLLASIADLLREELARFHVQDIATPESRAQVAAQEISRTFLENPPVLDDKLFRKRIERAISEIEARPNWNRRKLAQELGRGERSLGNWINGAVHDVSFQVVSRLAYISGYPITWFNGDIDDAELDRQRQAVSGAGEVAAMIAAAIEQHTEAIEALQRQLELVEQLARERLEKGMPELLDAVRAMSARLDTLTPGDQGE